MNVILLYFDYRQVSATHVAILRVLAARIQIYVYCVGIIPQLKSYSLVKSPVKS